MAEKSEYQKRIEQLKKRWKKTKPAESKGVSRVPEGRYQGECVAAKFDQATYRVSWAFKISRGDFAGTKLYSRNDLLWAPADGAGPDGLAYFKSTLNSLKLDYDSPEPAAIKKTLKKAVGSICDLFVKKNGNFQNVYVNGIVDADPDDEEEEEPEDEAEELADEAEDSEEDGEEESEEEEDEASNEEDEEDEEDEEETKELKPLFPPGQAVTFEHDGEKYAGKYIEPASEGSSMIAVDEDGEEETWEVENEDIKRKPGRPVGARNKPKKRSKKGKKAPAKIKTEPKADNDEALEDDDEWDDWDD